MFYFEEIKKQFFLASSILLFIVVKTVREQDLLLILEIQKKTSVGVCDERSIAVPISLSSPAAAARLSFSHLVMSPGWCVSGSSSTAGLVRCTWRSAKAKGFVAKGRPVLMWTRFLFT